MTPEIEVSNESPLPDKAADTQLDTTKIAQNQASYAMQCIRPVVEVFPNENKTLFAKLRLTGEVFNLAGKEYLEWMNAYLYEQTGRTLGKGAGQEVISCLSGLARKEAPRSVNLRFAADKGSYLLDLAQPGNANCVEISPEGWYLRENTNVAFQRPADVMPLPIPLRGGDFDPFWDFINVPDNRRLLFLTWIIDCLRPDTPYMVMELSGEQGTAKSTTQEFTRQLIDPNFVNLRSAPKSSEEAFISAGNSGLVSYENVSGLSKSVQDALCTISTGGGHAKRRLYSNQEEHLIRAMRPVIMNGISTPVTALDLIDRTISIELLPICARKEVSGLKDRFDAVHPMLLGGLLDVATEALRRLTETEIPVTQQSRFPEFLRLGMAIATVLGLPHEAFLKQFHEARDASISRTIEDNPVATAVMEWAKANPGGIQAPATELMHDMRRYQPNFGVWPNTPKAFAEALRRAAPALRSERIECKSLGKIGGRILWQITKTQHFEEI